MQQRRTDDAGARGRIYHIRIVQDLDASPAEHPQAVRHPDLRDDWSMGGSRRAAAV